MATYEICGTCSIHCEGDDTKVRLFPAVEYLSPCKKWAIFYPVEPISEARALLHATPVTGDLKEPFSWLLEKVYSSSLLFSS